MKITALLFLLIMTSCARLRRAPIERQTLHADTHLPIELTGSTTNWYHEFSCFDGPKTGRIYTTYVSDLRKVLGFLYEMETEYDLHYRLFNGNQMLREKMTIISTPKKVSFELAYCFYKTRRNRYSDIGEPDLLYVSVRLK